MHALWVMLLESQLSQPSETGRCWHCCVAIRTKWARKLSHYWHNNISYLSMDWRQGWFGGTSMLTCVIHFEPLRNWFPLYDLSCRMNHRSSYSSFFYTNFGVTSAFVDFEFPPIWSHAMHMVILTKTLMGALLQLFSQHFSVVCNPVRPEIAP